MDSAPCLTAWAESLGGITFPLLSDFYPHGYIAKCYGVLRPEGHSERALFVIDKEGIIRYVDVHDIDDQPDNEVVFRVLETLEPQGKELAISDAARAAAGAGGEGISETLAPEGDVVLYCTTWCPDCRRVRAYLQERGVVFSEVDISKNRAVALQLRKWTGGLETTPTLRVKGETVVGFDKVKIAHVLTTMGVTGD